MARWMCLWVLLAVSLIGVPVPVAAEGSRDMYPANASGARANLEWRNSTYGGRLYRRTLLQVYAKAGQYILVGSSAVDTPIDPDHPYNDGDIRIYKPGRITGSIGFGTIPPDPDFSCLEQRAATASTVQGRIGSRTQELAGPDTIADADNAQPGGQVPNGYVPCFYRADSDGIYPVVFFGPAGDNKDIQRRPTGIIGDNPAESEREANNFSSAQSTSVAVWDITVRDSLTSTLDRKGRVFAYYLAMFTGGNARPVSNQLYVVTRDGFRYSVQLREMDPNGYVFYGNRVGFLDTDGTPLYRDVVSVEGSRTFDEQNQLVELRGNVTIAPPDYPIFLNEPDDDVLTALKIPLIAQAPQVSALRFTGPTGTSETFVGQGGTFSFTSTVDGVFELIISRDGVDFEAINPRNRVLRGVRESPGAMTVVWDGRDNDGQPFEAGGGYQARVRMQGGEFHFPFLDVENSIGGGAIIELLNPPDINNDRQINELDCPQIIGKCFGAFYDDRGYRTANGTVVGTVNGALCPGNVGNPPNPPWSGSSGYDTRTTQRAFGFPNEGNPDNVCDRLGGFGDKKGLDLWTFYPGNAVSLPFAILDPAAITLAHFSATAQAEGVTLRWTTGSERDTLGFHLLRSATGRRADAVRVTPTLIAARGTVQDGASYSWLDRTAPLGQSLTYWLQEVTLDGSTHEYRSQQVRQRVGVEQRIFVPLVTFAP